MAMCSEERGQGAYGAVSCRASEPVGSEPKGQSASEVGSQWRHWPVVSHWSCKSIKQWAMGVIRERRIVRHWGCKSMKQWAVGVSGDGSLAQCPIGSLFHWLCCHTVPLDLAHTLWSAYCSNRSLRPLGHFATGSFLNSITTLLRHWPPCSLSSWLMAFSIALAQTVCQVANWPTCSASHWLTAPTIKAYRVFLDIPQQVPVAQHRTYCTVQYCTVQYTSV